MGIIISKIVDNKCVCCEGKGKYPIYRTCYLCQGTGYKYSIRRSIYNSTESVQDRYVNYKLRLY